MLIVWSQVVKLLEVCLLLGDDVVNILIKTSYDIKLTQNSINF